MPPADHSPPLSSPYPASASQNYGADAAGLICGYLLGTDTPPQEVDSAQAARWLASLQADAAPSGQFLWLHFNLSHAQAVRWMERHAHLPEGLDDQVAQNPQKSRLGRKKEIMGA